MKQPLTSVATQPAYRVIPEETDKNEPPYIIPLRYRKMENLHIVFWLFKDICWCILFKPVDIAMIFPTLIISIVIAWRTRRYVSELCHNMAITLWILANSYWMISEFFEFDTKTVTGNITYKHLALIPFLLGLLTLGVYYLYFKLKYKGAAETM